MATSTKRTYAIPMSAAPSHTQVCRTQSPCPCSVTDSMGMSLTKQWELVMDREALACCSPWGHKELDTTEQLNELN